MHTCGIIAEYNPFHDGHAYQINETRKRTGCDTVIVVMSGNWVQRGEPAITDKWKRAEAAVENGADVVIELPCFYALQAASQFAHGGITLLKKAGIEYLSFGSECGNLENLLDIADTPVNPDHLRAALDTGMSYPKAYSLLTSTMMPNDILAVSYLKEIKDTSIKPVVIQRTAGYLDDKLQDYASALAIRKALKEHVSVKDYTPMADVLENSIHVTMDQFYPYFRTYISMTPAEDLGKMFLIKEGIQNHMKKYAIQCSTYNEFLNAAVTHRYTAGRIRRSMVHMMLQITSEEVKNLPPLDTLRILAFNDQGRKWLHSKRDDIKTASRFADIPRPWREMEYRSTLLYTSVLPEQERKRLLDLEIKGAHYIKKREAD